MRQLPDARADAPLRSADWMTGLRRWYNGDGRLNSVIWLEGLAQRVKELARHQMLSAEDADSEPSSQSSFSPDTCPQCQKVTCSCLAVGEFLGATNHARSSAPGTCHVVGRSTRVKRGTSDAPHGACLHVGRHPGGND